MTPPRLIVISDSSRGSREVVLARIERCLAAAREGSVLVQLRDPELPARERLALGRALAALARRHGQAFAVNDRLDLARLLDADALHLGEASVDPADARRILPGAWISRAWRGTAEPPERADALLVAPVFEARHGRSPLGLAVLGAPHGSAKLYALGGVSAGNARAALEAGADGVAVIGAVLDHDDPLPLLGALGIRG